MCLHKPGKRQKAQRTASGCVTYTRLHHSDKGKDTARLQFCSSSQSTGFFSAVSVKQFGNLPVKLSRFYIALYFLCLMAHLAHKGLSAGINAHRSTKTNPSYSILQVGVIRGTYLALKHMNRLTGGRGGVIVSTSSIAGTKENSTFFAFLKKIEANNMK